MEAIIKQLKRHGVFLEIVDGNLKTMFLDTAPQAVKQFYAQHKQAIRDFLLRSSFQPSKDKSKYSLKLKDSLKDKACSRCEHVSTCEHNPLETYNFFQQTMLEFHIVPTPKQCVYIVNSREIYKMFPCEEEAIKAFWATAPPQCRYCKFASKDRSGDWWCSHPLLSGNSKNIVFHNLSLLKRCPNDENSPIFSKDVSGDGFSRQTH